AVLQRIETEVGELGNLFAGSPNSKDAALVLRTLLTRKDVVV
ncbi:MAG: hypothetical protein RIR81_461, partial [Actinomycetota bacterium]